MHINYTTLSSGLQVITAQMPSTDTVTVQIGVRAGARYETKEINGIAHFLEHIFFKGGEKYRDTKEVSEAIDTIGGEFNAFTGKEYVAYYVKTAKEDVDRSFDVLSDMMMHARFPQEEIEKERGVILEEVNMYEDRPSDKVQNEFDHLLFGDHPLGWEILGPKEVIKRLNREDFVTYQKAKYLPHNMVISVAGNITHEEVLKKVAQYFPYEKSSVAMPQYEKCKNHSEKVRVVMKPVEQAHLVFGMPACDAKDPDRYALKLLSIVLGGNMSSRMFLRIREAQGLCYYIYTSLDQLMDTGVFTCNAGVDVSRTQLAVDAIKKEFLLVQKEGVTKEELQKAKNFIKGKTTMFFEDTEHIADFYVRTLLLQDELPTLDELKKRYEAVTMDDIQRVIEKYIKPEEFRLALVGPEAVKAVTL